MTGVGLKGLKGLKGLVEIVRGLVGWCRGPILGSA
jgi:hypothetical protein